MRPATSLTPQNSLNFLTISHEILDGAAPKRPKKKFGRVIFGDATELDELVHESFQRATTFIKDQIEDQED